MIATILHKGRRRTAKARVRADACVQGEDARENGFTLLEVLVALAILGMSLAVLLGVFSQALDRTRDDQQRTAAGNLAQALLLEAETATPSTLKSVQGTTDAGLRWRLHVQDYGDDQDRTNWQERAVAIATIVAWDDHGRERSVSLATLRLLPKAKSHD